MRSKKYTKTFEIVNPNEYPWNQNGCIEIQYFNGKKTY